MHEKGGRFRKIRFKAQPRENQLINDSSWWGEAAAEPKLFRTLMLLRRVVLQK
jgi:hypothetical protein